MENASFLITQLNISNHIDQQYFPHLEAYTKGKTTSGMQKAM